MSNLLKGFNTRKVEERVIDYNEVISNKIQSFQQKLEKERIEADGFVSGLEADVVENLIADGVEAGDGFTVLTEGDALSVLASDVNAAATREDTAELRELAENIIADANAQAEEILNNARREAEALKNHAYQTAFEEGKKKGYEEGNISARAEYQALKDEVSNEHESLKAEYEERHNVMEHELVETLLEVFEKVTFTIAEDNREIVLHLINRVMSNIEATGDFLIRVSKADYPFLVENQGKIYCASAKDINLSVLEDSSLSKSQCIIETDGGVFNCSLDIQLEQLIKDIKLLSCV